MTTNEQSVAGSPAASTTSPALIALVWAIALIPLAWGFISTLIKAASLFE